MDSESEIKNPQNVSRKDRERERHKNDILDAAERVFVRDGFSAKIESIASEAEYAVGSIYNFFSSKDELFKCVLLRISQFRDEETAKLISEISDDPWSGFPKIVNFWISHHLAHGDFLHIAFSVRHAKTGNLFSEDESVYREIRTHAESYRRQMIDYFASLSGCDAVRKLDPAIMFCAFEGYLRTSMFNARRQGKDGVDWSEFENRVIGEFAQLFLN